MISIIHSCGYEYILRTSLTLVIDLVGTHTNVWPHVPPRVWSCHGVYALYSNATRAALVGGRPLDLWSCGDKRGTLRHNENIDRLILTRVDVQPLTTPMRSLQPTRRRWVLCLDGGDRARCPILLGSATIFWGTNSQTASDSCFIVCVWMIVCIHNWLMTWYRESFYYLNICIRILSVCPLWLGKKGEYDKMTGFCPSWHAQS